MSIKSYEIAVKSESAAKKYVSKYLQKNGFYAYSNKKIIEILNVTQEEMGELKTLINKEEKQKRN